MTANTIQFKQNKTKILFTAGHLIAFDDHCCCRCANCINGTHPWTTVDIVVSGTTNTEDGGQCSNFDATYTVPFGAFTIPEDTDGCHGLLQDFPYPGYSADCSDDPVHFTIQMAYLTYAITTASVTVHLVSEEVNGGGAPPFQRHAVYRWDNPSPGDPWDCSQILTLDLISNAWLCCTLPATISWEPN